MIPKKKMSYFEEETAKNVNKAKELWKDLKSSCQKSDKTKKSKISLKIDGAVQFNQW